MTFCVYYAVFWCFQCENNLFYLCCPDYVVFKLASLILVSFCCIVLSYHATGPSTPVSKMQQRRMLKYGAQTLLVRNYLVTLSVWPKNSFPIMHNVLNFPVAMSRSSHIRVTVLLLDWCWICSVSNQTQYMLLLAVAKKYPPKIFCCFLSNDLEF